jgi:hypothetical protein
MKLLLVTYYGEIDSMTHAANSLRKINYDVISYPLFQYQRDIHDKIDNYIEHFDEFINEHNPNIILWWYLPPTECIKIIYNKHVDRLHIMFNWDDPFVWDILPNSNIDEKAQYFDVAFISCEHSIKNYLEHGTPEAYCLYPGYEPTANYPKYNKEYKDYKYDISIGVTNLYEDSNFYKDQYINRKEFIDNIASMKDIKFAIYGPEILKKKYPNNYIGLFSYNKLNDVFNDSKINISLHVCDKNKYINERTILILGSGGLLFVDPIEGIKEVLGNDCCVYINKNNYKEQIRHILNNYDSYSKIKENGLNLSKKYTWNEWAKNIQIKLIDNYKYNNYHKIKKEKVANLSLDNYFLTWNHFVLFNYYLNNILHDKDITGNLQKIFLLHKQLPYLDINNILKEFINLSDL